MTRVPWDRNRKKTGVQHPSGHPLDAIPLPWGTLWVGNSSIRLPPYLPFSSTVQEGKAGGKSDLIIQPPALPGCEMGSGQGAGDAVILPGWSRKMKDDVRLIFSLIRQQTEMEGGEQEVGGWALY